jgi:hypothetical protein
VPSLRGYRLQNRQHIIRRQRPPDPLQLELADWLDLDGVLDLRQHTRTNQDLSRLGFIAKPRGNIGHRPDGRVIEAPLEADGAERSEAVRDADAKANVMAKGQFSIKSCIARPAPGCASN